MDMAEEKYDILCLTNKNTTITQKVIDLNAKRIFTSVYFLFAVKPLISRIKHKALNFPLQGLLIVFFCGHNELEVFWICKLNVVSFTYYNSNM